MSTQAVRGPDVRSYRRRKTVLDLDLNRFPPSENWEQEGPSTQLMPQEVQAGQQPPVVQPVMIDVEAIDDDVVESSPRAFAEARNNVRRNHRRPIVDVDLVDQQNLSYAVAFPPLDFLQPEYSERGREERTRGSNNNHNKRRRSTSNQTIINCDLYINLEGNSSSMRENVTKQPEPRKDPVFNCPICMGSLVEEMSTRCGHIFCKNCIKAALKVQSKCPTCRKRVTVRELIRVFLPSTS